MNAPLPSHLLPDIAQRETPAALIDALKSRFAERCSTALIVREQHGKDESSFAAPPPSAVVFAESTADVADAVKLASQYGVPVIAFGVGTSLEGHLLAVQGGISIDVSRMNQVLHINAEDLTVTVQPGVTRKQLNEEVKSTGLFFPKNAHASGRRGTTPTLRRFKASPAVARFQPTPACRSPDSPTACLNRWPRPMPAAFPTSSSAMWAMAISTSAI